MGVLRRFRAPIGCDLHAKTSPVLLVLLRPRPSTALHRQARFPENILEAAPEPIIGAARERGHALAAEGR